MNRLTTQELEELSADHVEVSSFPFRSSQKYCYSDGEPWPCWTVRAISELRERRAADVNQSTSQGSQ